MECAVYKEYINSTQLFIKCARINDTSLYYLPIDLILPTIRTIQAVDIKLTSQQIQSVIVFTNQLACISLCVVDLILLHPVCVRERASGSDMFESYSNNNNNNKSLETKIFFNSRNNQDTCRRAIKFCNSYAPQGKAKQHRARHKPAPAMKDKYPTCICIRDQNIAKC